MLPRQRRKSALNRLLVTTASLSTRALFLPCPLPFTTVSKKNITRDPQRTGHKCHAEVSEDLRFIMCDKFWVQRVPCVAACVVEPRGTAKIIHTTTTFESRKNSMQARILRIAMFEASHSLRTFYTQQRTCSFGAPAGAPPGMSSSRSLSSGDAF
jgi:hypothetical protein